MANSADPDQLASSEMQGISRLSRTRVKDHFQMTGFLAKECAQVLVYGLED